MSCTSFDCIAEYTGPTKNLFDELFILVGDKQVRKDPED
jgi:hypothetical protein